MKFLVLLRSMPEMLHHLIVVVEFSIVLSLMLESVGVFWWNNTHY